MNVEFIPVHIKLAPVLTSALALLIALKTVPQGRNISYISATKLYFESCKWFYNEILNGYIALGALHAGRHYFEQYEKRGLELNGPVFFVLLARRLTS
jgi:hypothetical protein